MRSNPTISRRVRIAPAPSPTAVDDGPLVARARDGDQEAFAVLVRRHSPALLRHARRHVASRASAEDVVQETWIGVLVGLDRFEGRSPFEPWLFGILVNQAKTRGVRDRRSVPFATQAAEDAGRAALPDGAWTSVPRRWQEDPEAALVSNEARRIVKAAIDRLPERQRIVMTLCDLEDLDPAEVQSILGVSAGNRRVLLHRARARVRLSLVTWRDAA